MDMYKVTFKVNGNRCQKTVMAGSSAQARDEVQSYYSERVTFISVQKVR